MSDSRHFKLDISHVIRHFKLLDPPIFVFLLQFNCPYGRSKALHPVTSQKIINIGVINYKLWKDSNLFFHSHKNVIKFLGKIPNFVMQRRGRVELTHFRVGGVQVRRYDSTWILIWSLNNITRSSTESYLSLWFIDFLSSRCVKIFLCFQNLFAFNGIESYKLPHKYSLVSSAR